jgi:hypothetical protein
MLTQPFFSHGFSSIIILHHFLPASWSCHSSVEHLIDIDAVGFTIQLLAMSLLVLDARHTWE